MKTRKRKLNCQQFIAQGSLVRCVLELYQHSPKRLISRKLSERTGTRSGMLRQVDWKDAVYELAKEMGILVIHTPTTPDRIKLSITITCPLIT